MTAWEDSGFPLVGHRDSPYGVRVGVPAQSVLLPPGAGGVWVRTVGHPRSGPPVIGVDNAPVLSGWGQALVQLPPGRHLVTAQIQGAGECGRTVEVTAGEIVELDFVESRLGGSGVLGPSGRVRGTGLTGPRLLAVILGVQAVAITMLVTLLRMDEGWLFALFGWLVWTVLGTWLLSLPIRWRGRAIIRSQSGEPIPYDADGSAPGTLLPALRRPPVPRLPDFHGGLLLHVDIDQDSTQDGSLRFDAHEAWTPPPTLSIGGVASAVGHGPWLYPLPAGVHRVRLVPPTVDGHEPEAAVELEVAIAAGRVTHYDVELRLDLAYGRGGHLSAYQPFLSAILRDKHSPPGSTRIAVANAGPPVSR